MIPNRMKSFVPQMKPQDLTVKIDGRRPGLYNHGERSEPLGMGGELERRRNFESGWSFAEQAECCENE